MEAFSIREIKGKPLEPWELRSAHSLMGYIYFFPQIILLPLPPTLTFAFFRIFQISDDSRFQPVPNTLRFPDYGIMQRRLYRCTHAQLPLDFIFGTIPQ